MYRSSGSCFQSVVFISILGLAACSEGSPASFSPSVRDSAGITIVENSSFIWRSGEAWSLSPEPTLTIGSIDGDAAYQLFQVRDARLLPHGRIAVAVGGSAEIRIYSPEGNHLFTAGRPGAGPGEFLMLSSLEPIADSVFAYDNLARRMSVFDGNGTFIRSFSIAAASPSHLLTGRFTDGSFALGGFQPGAVPRGDGQVRSQQIGTYLRVSSEGQVLDTIAQLSGPWQTISATGNRMSIVRDAFSPTVQVVAAGNRVIIGSGDEYQLRFYAASGAPQRIVRRAFPPKAVTTAHLELLAENRRIGERKYLPVYGQLRLDAEGNVWVEEYRLPGQGGPSQWDVFDPGGSWLGTVQLPERLRITEIGSESLLGVWQDEFGVEYVQSYQLTKP